MKLGYGLLTLWKAELKVECIFMESMMKNNSKNLKCKQNARNNKDLEGFLKDIRRIFQVFLDNYAEKILLSQNTFHITN